MSDMSADILQELMKLSEDALYKQCEEDAKQLFEQKMRPAAQDRRRFITINSKENPKLENNHYRRVLMNILKEKGLGVEERDGYYDGFYHLTISWDKKK